MGISDAITAVPEPSTSLLGALFALGLFRRRRN
jgi:MYXO-CTERM domain-containing protein